MTYPKPPYPHKDFMDESLESGGRCRYCETLSAVEYAKWFDGEALCSECGVVVE